MKRIRTVLAMCVCKLLSFTLRKLGRGGTTLPGRVALKVYPELLRVLSENVRVTAVTGTNGKTTTSRIIEEGMMLEGRSFFANRSGANLITGIAAAFAQNSSLFGNCRCDYAVIECDEAAFVEVSRQINPECIVVTNVFRDQLDRYGEVTHTLELIKRGVLNAPEAVLCINADCSLTSSITHETTRNVVYFGIDVAFDDDGMIGVSDAPYCAYCKTAYEYEYTTYGHLGGFSCPNCGYSRHGANVSAIGITEKADDFTLFKLRLYDREYDARVNLPGGYNVMNSLAAAAALNVTGCSDRTVLDALSGFSCGFGRMEKICVKGTDMRMILVKNPAGCNQAINYVAGLSEKHNLVLALNDRIADGTDISWIWDANYEKLCEAGGVETFYASGIRAEDMAVRLKYAGVDPARITVFKDEDKLLDELFSKGLPVCVMPTYTAMLDIRARLSKICNIKEFWE